MDAVSVRDARGRRYLPSILASAQEVPALRNPRSETTTATNLHRNRRVRDVQELIVAPAAATFGSCSPRLGGIAVKLNSVALLSVATPARRSICPSLRGRSLADMSNPRPPAFLRHPLGYSPNRAWRVRILGIVKPLAVRDSSACKRLEPSSRARAVLRRVRHLDPWAVSVSPLLRWGRSPHPGSL